MYIMGFVVTSCSIEHVELIYDDSKFILKFLIDNDKQSFFLNIGDR